MKFRIVSDSSSNVFSLPGVDYAYVPLKIVTEKKEYVDEPGLDIEKMVDEIKNTKGRSGTACPNVQEWLDAFDGADRIFAVTITSKLSGCYAAAKEAADEYEAANPGAKVLVIDSLSTGPEMRLIIEKIYEHMHFGHSFEHIKEAISEYQRQTKILFCLESLTNLARNGRVNPAVAKMAGVLGIRVIGAANEGVIQPLHKCRGEAKALDTIFDEMRSRGFSGGKVSISHCFNPEAAEKLRKKILSAFPRSSVRIEPCAALCSFYAEKGGLIVGFEGALA
ncbi:MAG: DegV family protein [Oscillospiraceae bacterium]